MRVWFHAPMKPPTHPTPSGDRRMARLLIRALTVGGHNVKLASALRAFDGSGDAERQRRIAGRARPVVRRLVEQGRFRGRPPDAWLTYHLYHKAPDWLGPAVCDALAIPYLIAEASRAPKRAEGPWAFNYAQCEAALARADAVLSLNAEDDPCVRPALRPGVPVVPLAPFLDPRPFETARAAAADARADLSARFSLDPDHPWLCTAAMMRRGDKARSYAVLAEALGNVAAPLLIAGDGEARAEVEALFAGRPAATVFLGQLSETELARLYAATDVFVWPAVNEAYGMALLEAQAAGTPVVAGREGGVSGIVADGESGLLTGAGDAAAFSTAVRRLLGDGAMRARLASGAVAAVARRHTLAAAAETLSTALRQVARP